MSCDFAANHYPFILVTLILPLIPSLSIVAGHLMSAGLGRRIDSRGDKFIVYNVALIPVIILLGLAFFKAAHDYTYLKAVAVDPETGRTVVIPWRAIMDRWDQAKLENITHCLAPYFTLAGLLLGLVPGIILLRRHIEAWYLHATTALSGALMFLYLETKPVREMYYAYKYWTNYHLPQGARPFDTIVWPVWGAHLTAGLTIGAAISISSYLVLTYRKRQLSHGKHQGIS